MDILKLLPPPTRSQRSASVSNKIQNYDQAQSLQKSASAADFAPLTIAPPLIIHEFSHTPVVTLRRQMSRSDNCLDQDNDEHKISFLVPLESSFPSKPTLQLPGHYARRRVRSLECLALGIPTPVVPAAKVQLSTLERQNIVALSPEIKLIADATSNTANAVKSAIDLLFSFPRKRILILSDLAEFGSNAELLHEDVGKYAQSKVDCVLAHGELSRFATQSFGQKGMHFESERKLFHALLSVLKIVDRCTILVKGSSDLSSASLVQKLKEYFGASKKTRRAFEKPAEVE